MVPHDPLAFLDLANQLTTGSPDETKLRTAIGRAYYAMFLIARDKTGIGDEENVHSKVIKAVRSLPSYSTVADQIGTLRRLRSVADYQIIPQKVSDQDWMRNWAIVKALIPRILPFLQSMPNRRV